MESAAFSTDDPGKLLVTGFYDNHTHTAIPYQFKMLIKYTKN